MKKINNYIIFALIIMFICVNNVYANYKVLCKYQLNFHMVNMNGKKIKCEGNADPILEIQLGDEGYKIKVPDECNWDKCKEECDYNIYDLGNDITAVQYSEYIFLSDEAKEDLNNYKCPQKVYVDLYGLDKGARTHVQSCFTNDKMDCDAFNDRVGYKAIFGYNEFAYNVNVTQDKADLYYGFADSNVPNAETAAEEYLKTKYVVDPNKTYEENYLCEKITKEAQVSKDDPNSLFYMMKQDFDTKFNEHIDRLYKTDGNVYTGNYIIGEKARKELDKYVAAKKNTDFSLDAVLYNNMKNDCDNLNQLRDNATQEEKDETSAALDAGFSELTQRLEDYFSSPYNINTGIKLEDFTGPEGCEGFLGKPETKGTPAYYLKFIMNVFKYLGIILCLAFSIMDFLKATTSQDKDLLQKAIGLSVKRLIYAIIIFFLPIIINFILGLIGAYSTCM